MIYIVGFEFQYNARPRVQASGMSVQEQIAMARHNLSQPKIASGVDPRFTLGTVYRISQIQRIKEDDIPKVKYRFANLSNPTIADIDIIVSDTGAGDNYVASLCGQTQSYIENRKKIDEAYALDTDF